MKRTIVLGLDGSEGSARACEWVASLAADLDVDITAVTVVDTTPFVYGISGVGPVAMPDTQVMQRAAEVELSAGMTAPLRAADVKYTIRVECGTPAEALVSVARQLHAHMVVVGTRGHGPLRELLLGSVGQALTHHAPCPVVVIPPHAAASTGRVESARVPVSATLSAQATA